MILHTDSFRRREHSPFAVQFRGVETHAHVGDESAEHENEIGGFNILPHVLVAAHRAAVDAEVERMIFRDRALAQEISRDRDVDPFRDLHGQVREAIARQLDARQNYRALRRAKERKRFLHRCCQRRRIGCSRAQLVVRGRWEFLRSAMSCGTSM